MAKRLILGAFLFAIAIGVGYYFQTAKHTDCKERGGTWVQTSTKDGYCDGVPPVRVNLSP